LGPSRNRSRLEISACFFQNFPQSHETHHLPKVRGAGLGLAISRKFCHLMGGDLTVTSVESEGSIFTATLPAVVQELTISPVS
jgi:signal transduction histidine kinase